MIGGGMSQSRWGINVTEDMGNGTKALVNLENRFLTDTGTQAVSQLFNQSWVGLQGGFGRVTVGRQYNVLFDLVTSTYASFPYSPYAEAFKPEIGFALGARNDNMVKVPEWTTGPEFSRAPWRLRKAVRVGQSANRALRLAMAAPARSWVRLASCSASRPTQCSSAAGNSSRKRLGTTRWVSP